MNNEKGSIIEQASLLFSQGQYELAKALYKKAGKKYGEHLFKANVWLCNKRLAQLENGEETVKVPVPNFTSNIASSPSYVEEQLEATQANLEKYYFEAQDLRNKLLDLQ
ncbi:hypothetical protein ACOJR9_16585 [Alteromonas sp. A081]|uniref:hypothetical protein n=1 Tax=Alteromonas sp. A081 TaxID=3410269 RepID=UPI003B9865DE